MKRVFIAGDAYSTRFFELPLEDEELYLMPYLLAASYHVARFALIMRDDGLANIGIREGNALLIADYSLEPVRGRPVLVRQEGEYIVRIAEDVNPLECVFTAAKKGVAPLVLPSENIRIIGVVSGIISPPYETGRIGNAGDTLF
ncbi:MULTISPECIES: hypothetical protein [Brevibacillus]|jgi:hypothetical protein|uniref:UPF0113 domain-containing protein n=1 Tax=Brevibacillus aydinogluensis TaxID=927786 RepID=A0AA48M9N1_9BACL|nr:MULTISPECIES: hypothetical protein [Bacillales]REK61984.1 MAG: hypothetical protein DF221_14265 [Brevibacillus sp.]UFJ62951.1 hypothetical protein IRT44_09595 [Anoxybacillus sediminis]CAJ1003815.1 UPF0113 domain-containing protein [Brevibacillus aydinogluensis]